MRHYNILVEVGFLRDAASQLLAAQSNLQQDFDISDKHNIDWYFDSKNKRMDFDYYYNELGLDEFAAKHMELVIKNDTDVLIINTPEGYVYCGYRKRDVINLAMVNYNEEGLLPYYTTKRKVDGRIVWFCLTWTIIPFNPPNYN